MIKETIRSIVRKFADLPTIGRLVRIVVAVIRMPETRAEHYLLTRKVEDLQSINQSLESLHHFKSEQLPRLLETISEINHKQVSADIDKENLIRSVPIALRKITRELIELKTDVQKHKSESEAKLSKVKTDISKNMDAIKIQIDDTLSETTKQLDKTLIDTSKSIQKEQGEHAESIQNLIANFNNLTNTCSFLLGRVEFVRRELMYEMKYGASNNLETQSLTQTNSKIINTEKIAVAKKNDQLKLNLGCGHIPKDGYINVDRRELPGVDVVAEVNALPESLQGLDEIYSSHLLEHFPQEQLIRELIPYYYELLKTNGRLVAIVPDAEKMIEEYSNGNYPYDDFREVLYGAQDYEGDFHFNMFTPKSLKTILENQGFRKIEVEAGRRNGKCYELEITAIK